jgi:hypothetical protein
MIETLLDTKKEDEIELAQIYLRRLIIDSLMAHAGNTLTPDIINTVAVDIVTHFSHAMDNARGLA